MNKGLLFWGICIIFAFFKDWNIYKNFVPHHYYVSTRCDGYVHKFEKVEKDYRQKILLLPGAHEVPYSNPLDDLLFERDILVYWTFELHPYCKSRLIYVRIDKEITLYNIFDAQNIFIVFWPFITPIKLLILLMRGY